MTSKRIERRLAAVLAADVAGYSRLMGRDEERTLSDLKSLRQTVVDPTIKEHRGRIVKTTGDGMLVEFASAVDAVTCAMELQGKLAEHADAAGQEIVFRIGINVGDIIIDGEDIFGDGVNVAARVENECEPGGVYISDDAFRQVRGKSLFTFVDLGERALKNIERPVRIYAVRTSYGNASELPSPNPGASVRSSPGAGRPLLLPDKPSIAALPFQNMSGDPEQEFFADGVVEDILTQLSRFKSLFVVARNSSFTFKGKSIDIKQVGRELGVRYVLEGSVRKGGGRVRITGQLIEAATGAHLWADKFDGALEDVFKLQDQVTRHVIGAIAPTIERAEMERARVRATERLDAYDYYIRGLAAAVEYSRDSTETALRHFREAIEIDPEYAAAHGRIAMATMTKRQNGWLADEAGEIRIGIHHARRAVQFCGSDAVALADGAVALAYLAQEIDPGVVLVAKALELNTNSAIVWIRSGLINTYAGNFETALDHLDQGVRLSPLDPQMPQTMNAIASVHFFQGDYLKARSWAERAVQQRPHNVVALRTLAASAACLGDLNLARQTANQILAVDPSSSVTKSLERTTLRAEGARERLADSLRLAGLPE